MTEDKMRELARWKSTHAPRIKALEELLAAAQLEAAKGAEAIATLNSERAANAILTEELERLRAEKGQAPVAEVHADHLRPAEHGGHWCREVLLYSGNNPGDQIANWPRVKLYAGHWPA